MAVILGTPGNDTLSALADGDIVFGLQGDDSLNSAFNNTVLFGGRGNDTLATDLTLPASGPTPTHAIAIQRGGAGDDTLHVSLFHLTGVALDVTTSDTFVSGGSGNDRIDVVNAMDPLRAPGDDVLTNTIDGGSGHDRIAVSGVTSLEGGEGTVLNVVTGGAGNDVLDATAHTRTRLDQLASNSLDGGAGDDVIHALARTSSNGDSAVATNELFGRGGNDVLEATQTSGTENLTLDATNSLDGGNGDDVLVADMNVRALFGMSALNALDGGGGNDVLTARLVATIAGVSLGFDVSNVLAGGNGNDRLEAYIEASRPFGELPPVENHLEGGGGNDVLVATIATGTIGSSFLDGAAGNDELTVVGGSGNILIGGAGDDTLIQGTGTDDTMRGDALGTAQFGNDTFVFNVDNGHDAIVDFGQGAIDVAGPDWGTDRIDVTALGIEDFSELTISAFDPTTHESTITFSPDNDVVVRSEVALTSDDFIFA
jgi:serralysin